MTESKKAEIRPVTSDYSISSNMGVTKHIATEGSMPGPLIFCCPSFSGPNCFQKTVH